MASAAVSVGTGGGSVERDGIAGPQTRARLGREPVQRHVPGFDQILNPRAGKRRHARGEELIEPQSARSVIGTESGSLHRDCRNSLYESF